MAEDSLPENKTCRKCGETKPLLEFARNKLSKGGFEHRCKRCACANAAKYRAENLDRCLANTRDWYARHGREHQRKRRQEKPEKIKEYRATYLGKNSAQNVARVAKWRAENPEKRRAQARAESSRRRSTPRGRLDGAMAGAIGASLKGAKAGRPWETLVGYTLADLVSHLESMFLPGMTWENYGRGGWVVDHKIPKSVFNYSSADHHDFLRCWSLENLQPLWERDNLVKAAKIEKPFQPSLSL